MYINVIGGLRIDETACDLGIVTALISSFKNLAIDSHYVFIGEVGLTGEVRAVSQIDKRITEAKRLGFTQIVIPASNLKLINKKSDAVAIKGISNIRELLQIIL